METVTDFIFLGSKITAECGRLRWRTERGREKLPHILGHVQKPGGPHARGVVAKRSYPTSQVRGSGRECQAAMAQEWPKGANPYPRSGVAAERSYPMSEIRASSLECQAAIAQEQLRGATPDPSPGEAAGRSYPMPEARSGSQDEQPQVQGAVAAWT